MPPSGGGTEIKMRDEKMIKELMHRVFVRTTNMDFSWNWGGGVAFYGIVRAWEVTGDDEYIEYLKGWVDNYLEEGLPEFTINTIALGYTVLALYKYTGDEKYMDIAKSQAEFLTNKTIRFGDGVYQHTVSEKNYNFDEQAWADTLFMAGLFLLEMQEDRYVDFALDQLFVHHKYLADKDGLYFHGYNGTDHMSAVKWGRANAWIIYSSAYFLEKTGDKRIFELVKRHTDALLRVRRADGGYGTVLDADESYTELSATGGIIAGINKAARLGAVDVQCDAEIILDNITPAGELSGVSTGTPVMPDKAAYMQIPTCPTLYGQALGILALM